MNDDRIADVYEGRHGTPQTQQHARERIHWMCRNVAGTDVLDLGCSQGIAALLLAREGKRVIGVDREARAIAQAVEALGAEEAPVRERASFFTGEGAALDLADDSFDTVLLGELLEHLVDPGAVLDEVRRVLRPSGRIVVTTPYGLFPYPDHKDPLYLGHVLELLQPRFAIDEVELLSRYLAIVGHVAAKRTAAPANVLSQALGVADRRLTEQDRRVEQQKQRIDALQSELRESREVERAAE
ncbi:MAG: hypothetical protein QOF76_2516, partial [Solirubrobacteraceae bacterium]|nr:hypothetical protein [Solirubrobacteraceae bacterium]